MATKTAAAANAASGNAVALKQPLLLLNQELAKLSEPQMLALIEQGRALAARLEQASVVDEDDYAAVLLNCQAAKTVEEQLDAAFEPFVAAGNSLHKGFIRWRDVGAGVNALENARAAAQRKAGQWQQQEQLKQQRRLKAEQEEREQQAEVQRLLDLEELEASGQVELASELAAAPIAPVAPPGAPEPVVERVKGTAYVEQWKYRITKTATEQLVDAVRTMRELGDVQEVADRLERIASYIVFDEKRVAATVRSLKGDTRIPFVDVWDEGNVRVGAA